MNIKKQNKGITLVALIITIIVLLILAGVVIALALNEDGIIEKTSNSIQAYEVEELKEYISLIRTEKLMENTNITDFELGNYIKDRIEASGKLDKFNCKIKSTVLIIDDEIVISLLNPTTPLVEGDPEEWHYSIRDNEVAWVSGYKGTDTEITIPECIVENGKKYPVVRINMPWNSAIEFRSNSDLQSVVIPNTVETIESWVFSSLNNLKTVVLPSSLQVLGIGAFNNSGIEKIKIPDSITVLEEEAGTGILSNCSNLKEIEFSRNLTVIPEFFANNCGALEKIVLYEGLKEIRKFAFANTTGLKSVELPNSLTTIGEQAFVGLHNIEQNLTIPTTVVDIGSNAFTSFALNTKGARNIKIFVPNDFVITDQFPMDIVERY